MTMGNIYLRMYHMMKQRTLGQLSHTKKKRLKRKEKKRAMILQFQKKK